MVINRNKLYLFLFLACVAGYIWLFVVLTSQKSEGIPVNVCVFKHVTGIPCPSCGSTRSVVSLVQGNIGQAIYTNPLGLVVASIMVIIPFWIMFDVGTKRKTLLDAYNKTEAIIKQPKYAIPLILLVIANWIWNIVKET